MSDQSAALNAAVELLVAAVNGGVREIVVCPGSRSQSLALVAAELERVGAIRLHVRIDERSAAFFALGLALETQTPVPIITTSGTAVANLHPALLEAHHAGVPLVALTADRPAEAVAAGANQATEQPGIFGPLIHTTSLSAPEGTPMDLEWAESAGRQLAQTTTAWHLNVAYRDPLSATVPDLSNRVEPYVAHDSDVTAAEKQDEADAAGRDPQTNWPGAAGDRRIHTPHRDIRGLPPELAELIANELSTATHEQTRVHAEATAQEPARMLDLDPAQWPGTIVVAGTGAGPEAERVARQGGWPLIAEVTSGARFGRNLLVAYRELLGERSPVPGLRDNIEQVLVFGRPTLSREVAALLISGVRVVIVDRPGLPPYSPTPAAEHVDGVRVTAFGATQHGASDELYLLRREAERALAAWVDASRAIEREHTSDPAAPDLAAARSTDSKTRADFGRSELAISREPVTRDMLVDAVWRHTWPHDRLVLAASRLIRNFDARVSGKRVQVFANRGLAGIDGTIATALGVAFGSQFVGDEKSATGTTRLAIGDLAFLHDVSSLLVGQGGEPAPRMQIIVGNDGGGTIFDGLEVAQTAGTAAFDRVQYTPQQADLAALARAFGWEYCRASTRAELEDALTDQHAPRKVIEVPLSR